MTTNNLHQTREADLIREINGRDGGMLRRDLKVEEVDLEARTVELSFSSETEVERWGWSEVLSHDDGACDMSRLNDGAALLEDHDWSKQRGVVEEAWMQDRKGRARVRFSRSAAGQDLLQDVADKIKTKVSVGYRIKAIKLVEERDNGVDVYRVTSWEPYEISFVSVPADTAVGTDRSLAKEEKTPMANAERTHETDTQLEPPTSQVETRMADKAEDQGNTIDAGAERNVGISAERDRVRAINDIAGKVEGNVEGVAELVRGAVANGDSPESFQAVIIEKLNERASKPLRDATGRSADIGLTDKEVRQYSFVKVIRALADPTNKTAQREAAFEFEASEAAEKNQERQSENFVIPTDVLRQSILAKGDQTRAFNSTKTGAAAGDTGGYSIATDLMASSFIEILRNKATIMKNGRILGGLVGNVDIPKQVASGQGYWIGEDQDAGGTGPELGQIALSMKTVAGYTDITRKLLKQSSLDVEALVRSDLATVLALTIDKAGYYGSGSANQPRGIANYAGINAQVFATAGKPTFAELVGMETQIALDNADVNGMRYVANAGFRGHAKTNRKFPDAVDGGTIWEQGNTVNGYGVDITNQITAGDVFFGNFADLIVAMWGGLELMVDPYSKSKSGGLRVVAFQDVDFALRRTESFCLGRAV